jgi:hypothetical protein
MLGDDAGVHGEARLARSSGDAALLNGEISRT